MNTKKISVMAAGVMLAATAFAGVAQAADSTVPASSEVTPVIVVLNEGADAKTVAGKSGAKLKKSFDTLSIASLDATADQVDAISSDPSVAFVVPDTEVEATGTQYSPQWNLDRVDQQTMPLDNTYNYADDGSGITIYVADSGLLSTHTEFSGRVAPGFDAIGDGYGTGDCNGHGTFVAALAAGSYYGVAKAATVIPVRVLGCDGTGTWSQVIAGIDWVVNHHVAGTQSVLNLSLRGDANDAADAAVQRAINDGIVVTVAAGNDSLDACNYSPARVPDALTIGATNSSDGFSWFSNSGACVDMFAPGEGISSAYNRSDTDGVVMSGTSASSPMVAGAAAVAFARDRRATASAVVAGLKNWATANIVTGVPAGTPNWMLFIPAGNVKLSTSLSTSTGGRRR